MNSPFIDRVFGRINYERKNPANPVEGFKLETVETLLAKLGNPHHELNVVHIAGTKGKGSTAQFVARIANQLGLKTGVYSSPHLHRYEERFAVDGTDCPTELLNSVLARVFDVVDQIDEQIAAGRQLAPPTFFDISTAAAMELFREERVDLAVLEVGLGGRLDSTNVCRPQVSVITSIGKDHTRQLGSRISQIAAEKAGIIKPNCPVVCGVVQTEIIEQIRSLANQKQAPFHQLEHEFEISLSSAPPDRTFSPESLKPDSNSEQPLGTEFAYLDSTHGIKIDNLRLAIPGSHQIRNAALAIRSIIEFQKVTFANSRQTEKIQSAPQPGTPQWKMAVATGLNGTKIRGRFELIRSDPPLIFDMAHNEDSIRAMIANVKELWPAGNRQVVFACARDKDAQAMLAQLSEAFDRIILTQFQSNPRSQSTGKLRTFLSRGRRSSKVSSTPGQLPIPTDAARRDKPEILEIPDSVEAFREAENQAMKYAVTAVCGSIFLVGELLESIQHQTASQTLNT